VRVRGDMKIVSRTEEKVRRTSLSSVKGNATGQPLEGSPINICFGRADAGRVDKQPRNHLEGSRDVTRSLVGLDPTCHI
jgi:hypothetical protein